MKGMEGDAGANKDNQITAGELHAYVQQNVIQQSSGSQTPELQGDADRVLVRFSKHANDSNFCPFSSKNSFIGAYLSADGHHRFPNLNSLAPLIYDTFSQMSRAGNHMG